MCFEIEDFLDREEQAAQLKLTIIEDEVLALRERFGQRLAEAALLNCRQMREVILQRPLAGSR